MKQILLIAAMTVFSASALADTWVKGHTRKDGTYVEGHYRSSPNSNRYDNYSSQGSSNPYTGQRGSQRNEYSTQPQWNNSYGNGQGESLNRIYNPRY